MSRRRGAVKKIFWQGKSPWEKWFIFHYGEKFANPDNYDSDVSKLAIEIFYFCNCEKKIPTSSVEELDKRLTEWDSGDLIMLMIRTFNQVLECHRENSGKKLHALADAITMVHCRQNKDVDPERAWLMPYLFRDEMFYENSSSNTRQKTFSEIRDAFFRKFPDSSIEPSSLRTMVMELGYICLKGKPGPKGPRVLH